MADVADQASGLMEEHLARADSGTACLACEAEIPPARRAALPGCRLCLRCQEGMERSRWR